MAAPIPPGEGSTDFYDFELNGEGLHVCPCGHSFSNDDEGAKKRRPRSLQLHRGTEKHVKWLHSWKMTNDLLYRAADNLKKRMAFETGMFKHQFATAATTAVATAPSPAAAVALSPAPAAAPTPAAAAAPSPAVAAAPIPAAAAVEDYGGADSEDGIGELDALSGEGDIVVFKLSTSSSASVAAAAAPAALQLVDFVNVAAVAPAVVQPAADPDGVEAAPAVVAPVAELVVGPIAELDVSDELVDELGGAPLEQSNAAMDGMAGQFDDVVDAQHDEQFYCEERFPPVILCERIDISKMFITEVHRFASSFPWQRAENETFLKGVEVTSRGRVHISECERTLPPGAMTDVCGPCDTWLRRNEMNLARIAKTAAAPGASSSIPYGFRNMAQLVSGLRQKNNARFELRLSLFNLRRRNVALSTSVSVWHEIGALLAAGDLPRLQLVMQRLLQHNARPSTIRDKLVAIAAGLISRGPWTPREIAVATIVNELGGARAGFALMKVCQKPSRRTLQKQQVDSALSVTTFLPTAVVDVVHNLSVALKGKGYYVRNLMIDETHVEQDVQLEPDSVVMGLCLQHSSTRPVASSAAALYSLHDALVTDKVHKARECIIASINSLDEAEAVAMPIFMGGSCARTTVEFENCVAESLFAAYTTRCPPGSGKTFEQMYGPIVTYSTDGASTRGRMLEQGRVSKEDISNGSMTADRRELPFPGLKRKIIFHLPGADLLLPLFKTSAAVFKDWLHMIKRLRARLVRLLGLVVSSLFFIACKWYIIIYSFPLVPHPRSTLT